MNQHCLLYCIIPPPLLAWHLPFTQSINGTRLHYPLPFSIRPCPCTRTHNVTLCLLTTATHRRQVQQLQKMSTLSATGSWRVGGWVKQKGRILSLLFSSHPEGMSLVSTLNDIKSLHGTKLFVGVCVCILQEWTHFPWLIFYCRPFLLLSLLNVPWRMIVIVIRTDPFRYVFPPFRMTWLFQSSRLRGWKRRN